MTADFPTGITTLHVDGGMAANNWLLQFLADILNINITRPACIETSAMGVACLASLQVGVFSSLEDIARHSKVDRVFKPKMDTAERTQLYKGWKEAVRQLLM